MEFEEEGRRRSAKEAARQIEGGWTTHDLFDPVATPFLFAALVVPSAVLSIRTTSSEDVSLEWKRQKGSTHVSSPFFFSLFSNATTEERTHPFSDQGAPVFFPFPLAFVVFSFGLGVLSKYESMVPVLFEASTTGRKGLSVRGGVRDVMTVTFSSSQLYHLSSLMKRRRRNTKCKSAREGREQARRPKDERERKRELVTHSSL